MVRRRFFFFISCADSLRVASGNQVGLDYGSRSLLSCFTNFCHYDSGWFISSGSDAASREETSYWHQA